MNIFINLSYYRKYFGKLKVIGWSEVNKKYREKKKLECYILILFWFGWLY